MTFKSLIPLENDPLWYIKFTKDELQFLYDELDALQHNGFKGNDKMSWQLIGAIEHEYRLSIDTQNSLETLLQPLLRQQVTQTTFSNEFSALNDDVPIVMNDTWVNFQKKYEYNPVHHHMGVFSFVLWLKIPYTRESENNHPGAKGMNGNFCMFFTDQQGKIQTNEIQLDDSYEGICLMFPSETRHCVYPFYTSDEYRISVSGNYVCKATSKNTTGRHWKVS